ncbi:MAG TPA: 4Fe-4S dicluster domain-containing protein [Bacteroidota bacterium]|nr:4Fe-4S dicluster domain-containing protein [Bacteroidota bacterium]
MKDPFSEQAGQKIKFESELDRSFGETISHRVSNGTLMACIQCGTCSATCPLSTYMDFTPRKIIAMVRAGFREEVLTNQTIWLCASCYSCTVECPKGIRITEVMYALKREAITHGFYPKRFSIPVLARTFYDQVRSRGRLSEVYLMMRYYLATNPLRSLGQIGLALRLFKRGRLTLFEKGVKEKAGLRKILETADRRREVPS